jgi:pimeloyl-ACP methyl ester carboxylesterase
MRYQLDAGYLAYDHIGKGIPLLFIHGYPLSRRIWNPQLAGLSDIASIISVDMAGLNPIHSKLPTVWSYSQKTATGYWSTSNFNYP